MSTFYKPAIPPKLVLKGQFYLLIAFFVSRVGIFHSKLVYLINVWGGAPIYLLKALQVQQMIAARTVCGFQCARWSRSRILKTVGWLSVRQLIEFHAILQVHKTLGSGYPRLLYEDFDCDHPYQTRTYKEIY